MISSSECNGEDEWRVNVAVVGVDLHGCACTVHSVVHTVCAPVCPEWSDLRADPIILMPCNLITCLDGSDSYLEESIIREVRTYR